MNSPVKTCLCGLPARRVLSANNNYYWNCPQKGVKNAKCCKFYEGERSNQQSFDSGQTEQETQARNQLSGNKRPYSMISDDSGESIVSTYATYNFLAMLSRIDRIELQISELLELRKDVQMLKEALTNNKVDSM